MWGGILGLHLKSRQVMSPSYLSPGFLWESLSPCVTQSSLSPEDPKAQIYMTSSSSGLVSEQLPSLLFPLPFGAV